MMMHKVRLGIIGAGWAARQHLEVIRHVKGMQAVGITSRTKSKAQNLARAYGIGVCTDDVQSLIDKAKPDALMVLVSPDQMYKVAASVIPFGLPLFLEKPAGLTPEENLKLMHLAKKYSLLSMVGFNRRYYSVFHKGMKIIKDNGRLLGVGVEGHERMWRVRQANHFSEKVLRQWLFANSTHTIDLLRFFGGEPANIYSLVHKYSETRGDQFAAIMDLKSGTIGQYVSHWYSPGGWRVVLYGEGVTVEFKPLENGRWVDKNFKTHEIIPEKADVQFKPGFFRQMEAFGNLVRRRKQEWPMLDLGGSYQTMLLAQQILIGSCRSRAKAKAVLQRRKIL